MESLLTVFNRLQAIQSRMNATFQGFLMQSPRTASAPKNSGESAQATKNSFDQALASELAQKASSASPSEQAATKKSLPFERWVSESADRHGLPEGLLHAVIRQESNYNPQVTSPKGAQGLMQLMPNTAKELGVFDAYEPKANIDGGAKYLKQLLNRYDNNLVEALAAYNAGPSKVGTGASRIPNYPETHDFIKRVITNYLNHSGAK